MRDGGERRYIAFNLKHFREMLLKDIDQAALDNAAETLLPTAAPDYRNRKVYTPVIAILRQALGDKCPTFRRPKGSKGTERKGFMWPEDAFDVIDEAEKDDPEFGLYLFSLLYTGIRKSEGLDALKVDVPPKISHYGYAIPRTAIRACSGCARTLPIAFKHTLKRFRKAASAFSGSGTADISNTSCCAPRWPSVAYRAPSAGRQGGSRRNSGCAS